MVEPVGEPGKSGKGNNMFHFNCLIGNNKHPYENRQVVLTDLEALLFFITGFMTRHEETWIIETAVDESFYDFIHSAANACDQPDIRMRKRRIE